MKEITDNLPLFIDGILGTLRICAVAALGSLVLGTIIAIFRVSPVPALQKLGTAWVQFVRNCPLTVVLFFMAFGLPEIGLSASYFTFGVIGLALYTSAFVCEAIRAGVNSVPSGQAEAARAVGFSFGPTLGLVVMPQALRYTVPPMANAMIAMIKNSAIVGAFGVGGELFTVADTLTSSQGLAALPVLTGVVIGYLIIIIPTGLLFGWVERKGAIAK
jgi:glutamate transport system permease protein